MNQAVATLTLLAAQNRKKAKETTRRAAVARTPKAASEGTGRDLKQSIQDHQRRRKAGGSVEGSSGSNGQGSNLKAGW
jgi:hypothetical protein